MSTGKEYDEWLAKSLDEARALLKQKALKPGLFGELARDDIQKASKSASQSLQIDGCGDAIETIWQSEPVILQMIGLLTLVALRANFDRFDIEIAGAAEDDRHRVEALASLTEAVQEARTGHVQAARRHIATALRRLKVKSNRIH